MKFFIVVRSSRIGFTLWLVPLLWLHELLSLYPSVSSPPRFETPWTRKKRRGEIKKFEYLHFSRDCKPRLFFPFFLFFFKTFQEVLLRLISFDRGIFEIFLFLFFFFFFFGGEKKIFLSTHFFISRRVILREFRRFCATLFLLVSTV